MSDPRVTTEQGDVAAIVAGTKGLFDAIILDVDNSSDAFTTSSNNNLYSRKGLNQFRHKLKPEGVLAIWSIENNKDFVLRMERSGYKVEVVEASARPDNKGARHYIYLGVVK